MTTHVTTFNDRPIIVLQAEKFNLQLGLSKAKLVLEHIDEIKAFVEANAPVVVEK